MEMPRFKLNLDRIAPHVGFCRHRAQMIGKVMFFKMPYNMSYMTLFGELNEWKNDNASMLRISVRTDDVSFA